MSDDQDWRLVVDLSGSQDADQLAAQLTEGPLREAAGHDVVITHDGDHVYVYAANSQDAERTQRLIEDELAARGGSARLEIGHWDPGSEQWRDPSSPGGDEPAQPAGGDVIQERTIVAVAGNLERALYETDVLNYARSRGLSCEVVEHRHLLTTQVAFHVSGTAARLTEFEAYVKREARRTIRVDPGTIPLGLP